MTMFDPASEPKSGPDAMNWVQDQLVQIKAMIARLQQQGEQTQAGMLDVNERLRDADGRLRELGSKTTGLPQIREQVQQLSGLLERIQDAEVLIDTKFELMERTGHEERTRDQAEKNDMFRRVQDLERRAEALAERQSTIDDTYRRFQEEVSRSHLQYQGHEQRLEALESRSSRNLDATNRLEQAHAEIEQAIRGLRREDDVLAERARLAHEVASRLETELNTHEEELRTLPLLQERVELLRAERQRLEDRTSHIEESLEDARTRLEREEDSTTHVELRLRAHESRIDQVHSSMQEYRRAMNEHLLKLNQMLERMKRREVEELERQAKELRTQQNALKNEDE
jgi:chromosome segregation ATPase